MAKRIIGLDISSRRLLAVEVENPKSKSPTLTRAYAMPLPDGAARDSEVIDTIQVSEALRALWKNGKFSTKNVVLGVGNQRVLVREHTAPLMSASDLRQALPYQVQEMLPVPVSETILDFYPIEKFQEDGGPEQVRGLLVAAIKESVELSVAAVEDADLRVQQVDLSPFAIVRALSSGNPPEGTHTVLMISSRTTFIIVVKDGVPQFVRIVPAGAENITDAIIDHGIESREAAERFKHEVGIASGARTEYAPIAEAMLDVLRNIISSVRSTNTYYQNNFEGEPSRSVILLGRDTKMPGLSQAIGEYLAVPVSFGNPFVGISVPENVSKEFMTEWDLDLAVPIGLALGSS